jgi:hypothetical protein
VAKKAKPVKLGARQQVVANSSVRFVTGGTTAFAVRTVLYGTAQFAAPVKVAGIAQYALLLTKYTCVSGNVRVMTVQTQTAHKRLMLDR